MNCPIDNTPLSITERQGVEIDYCPQCRGVWLDRGELDKIIDKADTAYASHQSASAHPQQRQEYREERHDDRRYDSHHGKKKKKESFLEDIFDF